MQVGDGSPPFFEGSDRETGRRPGDFGVLLEHLVQILDIAHDVVIADTSEPDLGLELGPGFDEQHDLLVWVDHAADILGKATFQANVHRPDQAAGRELPGVAGVEEHGTSARMIAGGLD